MSERIRLEPLCIGMCRCLATFASSRMTSMRAREKSFGWGLSKRIHLMEFSALQIRCNNSGKVTTVPSSSV